MSDVVADITGARRVFHTSKGAVKALDGVDLVIKAGESIGLVGESGSGKSTLANIVIGLDRPTDGTVHLWGRDPGALSRVERTAMRRRIGVVFQDPFLSLDPKLSLGRIVTEPLAIHGIGTRADRAARARELLEDVGLPADWVGRRAAQLSGGQRQRVAIARAIALEPDLLVLDEPVSALDVSVQAQILNLLQRLRERMHFASLLVSHDLAVVRHVADRVAVMYLGRIVEESPADELFDSPQHPYSIALLSSSVDLDSERASSRILLAGDLPSPIDLPSGCRFRTRCFRSTSMCRDVDPLLAPAATPAHRVACVAPGAFGSHPADHGAQRSHDTGAHRGADPAIHGEPIPTKGERR